jgi:hypothetical protein
MGVDKIRTWLHTMLQNGATAVSDAAGILLGTRIIQLRGEGAAEHIEDSDQIKGWLKIMLTQGSPPVSDSAGILFSVRIQQLRLLSEKQALKDQKRTKPQAPKPGPFSLLTSSGS